MAKTAFGMNLNAYRIFEVYHLLKFQVGTWLLGAEPVDGRARRAISGLNHLAKGTLTW